MVLYEAQKTARVECIELFFPFFFLSLMTCFMCESMFVMTVRNHHSKTVQSKFHRSGWPRWGNAEIKLGAWLHEKMGKGSLGGPAWATELSGERWFRLQVVYLTSVAASSRGPMSGMQPADGGVRSPRSAMALEPDRPEVQP